MTSKELLKQLRDMGAKEAIANYDGSGDSGTVESVSATDAKNDEVKLPEDVEKAIAEAAEKHLEEHGIDWYNNDGGFGEFIIDVDKGTRTLKHNTRISDTEYEEHDDEMPKDEEAPEQVAEEMAVCTCETLIHGHHKGCPFIKKD